MHILVVLSVLLLTALLFGVSNSADHCGPDTILGPEQEDQILSDRSPNFRLLLSATEFSRASCVDKCCNTDMCNIMSYNESAFMEQGINCFLYTCLPLETCYFQDALDVVSLTILPKDDSDDTTSLIDNQKIQKEVDTRDGPQRDKEIISEQIVDIINNTIGGTKITNHPSTTNNIQSTKTFPSTQTTNQSPSTSSNQKTSTSDKSTINLEVKTTDNTVPSSLSVTNTSTFKPSTKTSTGISSTGNSTVSKSTGSSTVSNSQINQTTAKMTPTNTVNNINSSTFSKDSMTSNVMSSPEQSVSTKIVNNTDKSTTQEHQNTANNILTSPSKMATDKTTLVTVNQANTFPALQLNASTTQITNITTENKPSSSTTTTTTTTPTTTTTTQAAITNATTAHEQETTIEKEKATTQKLDTTTAKQITSTNKQMITTESLQQSTVGVLEKTDDGQSVLNKANQNLSSTAKEEIYENIPPVFDKKETILPEQLFTSNIDEDNVLVTPHQASAKLEIPNIQNNTMNQTVGMTTQNNSLILNMVSDVAQVDAKDVTVINNTIYFGDLNITFADSTLKEEAEESHVLSTALIAALSFGILFFFAVLVLLGRRCFDSWQKRHYSRVDYLVNGMYN